jgi:hypothetical protein
MFSPPDRRGNREVAFVDLTSSVFPGTECKYMKRRRISALPDTEGIPGASGKTGRSRLV